ncbi:MAG TPA: TIR domain-containing protein [Mycobacterium sp.]|nr:TIR domain-containing protein [Mycobacterium sp.]
MIAKERKGCLLSRIFLSHSSRNARETIALYKWLVNEDPALDGEIFLDIDPENGIPTGANWREALNRASRRCEAVICLLSEKWERSEECRREYWIAHQLGKKIFCALLEPGVGEDLTGDLQHCELFGDGDTVSIDVDGGEPVRFAREGLRRLYIGIRRAGINVASFPWPPDDQPDRAPYRGWEPFEAIDAGVFFGRDGEIARAMDELHDMRAAGTQTLFVVLGASGAGKSSFLRAGIMPRLRKDDRNFVDLGILRPERNALTGETGLAQSIWTTRHRLGMSAPPLGEIKVACSTGDATQVRQWLIEIRDAAVNQIGNIREGDLPPSVVLPLDQAEELFAVDAGPQAKELLRLIHDIAVGNDDVSLIVIATIRTDRYPVMQTASELDGLLPRQFDLLPMRTVQYKEVITGPARRGSLRLDGKLVDRLLNDCTEGADMLPLLSLTLEGLYRDYGSTRHLTLAAYEAQGGIEHVVQKKVDDVLSHDPAEREEQLQLLRSAFIPWLATINPANNKPMRRFARYSDLPEASRPLIDALVANRLLVKDARGGEVVVEVALEILLQQWEDLARWLADEKDALKAADNLEHDAIEWHNSDQDPSWLLEGKRLANAEELVATPGFRERLADTQEYVQASRRKEVEEAREKQQAAEKNARVLRSLLALTVVIALAAAAGFVWALKSQRDAVRSAKEATAQRLVPEAQAMLQGSREGSDVQAFQELLAANHLAASGNSGPIVDALVRRFSTVRIDIDSVPVIGAAFAAQAHRLAAADTDGRIRVWDTSSDTWHTAPLDAPQLITTKRKLASVAVSPDGRWLLAGTEDGPVLRWNLAAGNPPEEMVAQHTGKVTSVAFSRDGSRLASAGADGTIRLSSGNQPVGPVIHTDAAVFSVAFDPIRDRVASGGADGFIRFWNASTGAPEGVFQAHKDGVMSVTFSPNGQLIASGGIDGAVRVWDAATNQDTGPFTSAAGKGHTEAVMSVAFNADGTRVVSAGIDYTVQMWDVARRQRIGDAMTGHQGVVWSAVFVNDGHQIVSAGNDHELRVWNADVGQPISTPLTQGRGTVTSLAISDTRIASATADGTVQLWDSETGRTVAVLEGHNGVVNSVAFTGDGDQLATGSVDGTIRLWRAEDGVPVRTLTVGRPVYSVAFSPKDGRLASASGDGQLTMWDMPSGTPHQFPNPDHAVVFGIALNRNGDRLASGSADGILRMWDSSSGTQIWQQNIVNALTSSQRREWTSDRPAVITSIAFSPDGRLVASGGASYSEPNAWSLGMIQRWNAESGSAAGQPNRVAGGGSAIMSVAFIPHRADTKTDRLVSGGFDRTVRLWNANSDAGEQIGPSMLGPSEAVGTIAVSPDGTRIIAGSADGTIRMWPNPPSVKPADALCAKLTRNMSPNQWNLWVSSKIDFVDLCPGLPEAQTS